MNNINYEKINISNYINCVLENGIIYQVSYMGEKTQIGVDNATIEQSLNQCEEYYQKLVEMGVIEVPKTPEELMQEMMITMKAMQEKIDKLESKEAKNEHSIDSKNAGNRQQRGKSSNGSGEQV